MKLKKATTVAITGMMVLAMATGVCSAATITTPDGTASQNVQATYATNGEAGTVHSVDIEWGGLQYTYTVPTEGTWNPASHSFTGAVEGTWGCETDADKIKVTNHSNTAVKASFSYTEEQAYSSITGSFDNAEVNLATAEGTTLENAPSATAKLRLEGALNKNVTAATTIGTVTVSLGEI